jgi:RimJ/RimL family protein N-acetyltransferase
MSDEVALRLVREDQTAMGKTGFTRKEITRATGWRDGAWRDGVIYSLLRTDPAV